mmetsp:Transcript_27752/g.34704  ORF Transcript_27752/g.34704 Transcript_27752/m.34704 type:complete len:546 (+) Transcript_27752:38-1675(+)
MAALTAILPTPQHNYVVHRDEAPVIAPLNQSRKEPPAYTRRHGFVPRGVHDFGDGGAFPEIHVVQYPLNMGRPKDSKGSSSAIVAVDVNKDGQVQYDAIVKQGSKNKKIFTKHDDLKEKEGNTDALTLPSHEEASATADATRAALEKIIGKKVEAAKPVKIPGEKKEKEPQFIRYTPNPSAPGYNPNAKQRVIRLVEAQVDPMEPPKHKHKKVPRGPPSPPVPVLHSPPRKVTVKDQQAWKIPPCISNWKNARGYTIPLDKRLAADGRGLQEFTINDNFATLSEALIIAERKAREQLTIKQKLKQQLAMKEKEKKEQDLRELAKRARMERAGLTVGTPARGGATPGRGGATPARGGATPSKAAAGGEDKAAKERDRIRQERKRDREREMRLDNLKGSQKKSKLDRDANRDISEKIALGMHTGKQKLAGDQMFDSRLFNQSAGMDSGFGADDEYNAYSKPLFDRQEAASVYRPKKSDAEMYGDANEQYDKLVNTDRFRPDKGFKGTEYTSAQSRDAPVQFEREEEELDPFGLDQFLTDAKKGKKKG